MHGQALSGRIGSPRPRGCPCARRPRARRERPVARPRAEDPSGQASRDAILARIKKAKEYGKSREAETLSAGGGTPDASASTGRDSREQTAEAPPASFQNPYINAKARIAQAKQYQSPPIATDRAARVNEAARDRASVPEEHSSATYNEAMNLTAANARSDGSASEAASFLKAVLEDETRSINPDLRPEEFTARKEAQQKAQGAEIITADPRYEPGRAEGDAPTAYRPKIATWGVFERPADISKQYGGGRTIRPGQALESEEKGRAREARTAALLLEFRRKSGLEVEPGVEAAARENYENGATLAAAGRLDAAASKFAAAAAALPLRSQLGGEATLQQAICLDSLGRGDDAYALYVTLERHPNGAVAKKAKQMLFGFRSMDYLKTHTMTYSVDPEAYSKYFNKLTGQWAYYSAQDQEPEDLLLPTVVATSVMLAPLLLLGFKIGSKVLKL